MIHIAHLMGDLHHIFPLDIDLMQNTAKFWFRHIRDLGRPESYFFLHLMVRVIEGKKLSPELIGAVNQPRHLVGKRVMAIVNLAPRKIAGEESQGMLLSALDETGKLCLMTTMDETIAAGAEVC